MADWSFFKMHGLGNDFVILDLRGSPGGDVDAAAVRRIANRRHGLGCDQLIVLHPAEEADCRMAIFNADGSPAGACGNAARCVARLLMEETGRAEATILVGPRRLAARRCDCGEIAVDMGEARFDWQDIPLARAVQTDPLPLAFADLPAAAAVSVGNPHVVFLVPEVEELPLTRIAEEVLADPLLVDGANVSLVAPEQGEATGRATGLRMRVFERGVGPTPSCGSAAVAAAAVAHRRGLVDRRVRVRQPGGSLTVEIGEDGHLWLEGPAALVARGVLASELLAGAMAEDAPA